MNKKILIALAIASIFISAQATYVAVPCYSAGTTADTNCLKCPTSTPATCTACAPGYFLSTGVCTACASTAGCLVCTSAAATACTTAANGYFLLSGTATACGDTTGCKVCSAAATTACTTANNGYFLSTGTATGCASTTNCLTCSAAGAAFCTSAAPGYFLSGGNPGTATVCGDGNCATCAAAGTSQCTACKAGYFLTGTSPNTCTACASTAGCTTCTSATATTCSAANALYFLLGGTPGTATACGDTLNCAACSAVDVCTTCNKGTKDANGICCGVPNCATCVTPATANTNTMCGACSAGYGLVSGACTICTIANCGVCDTTVATCTACKSGYANTAATGAAFVCVATTPVPSTDSPSTAAFNVTPTAVFLNTETSTPAFTGVSGPALYGPGFDSSTEYVWVVVVPTVTGVVSVNRRALNGTYGGSLGKINGTADVAITTAIPTTATMGSQAVAPGYFAFSSYVMGTNWGGFTSTGTAATATASEISVTYIAVNGSSATTKAITSNTNTNVYFSPQSLWIDTGVIYITYAMATHTAGAVAATGVTAAADAFAVNGIYIQGITISTGALLYNTTGGVKAITITQSVAGSTTGCVSAASSSSICASNPLNNYYTSAVSSFSVGGTNITNSTTVNYLWSDRSGTSNYNVIKTGTITLATGAGTSGTALATEAASTSTLAAATTAAPYIVTSYGPAGFLGSFATSGVFISKTVQTYSTPTGTPVITSTIQGYINGSSTAASNVTIVSGYSAPFITGYGTSDGFVLVEQHYAQTAPANNQRTLVQIERFFTNGSTNGGAVNLGTYQDAVYTHQDANGSIYVGYTISNTISPYGTYSGMLGKYLAQSLASGASTLTSIFAFLSLMIVALFAF